jgi:hypothetical protein
MMTEDHFSQPAESPAHVARCTSRISSALVIGPPLSMHPPNMEVLLAERIMPDRSAAVDRCSDVSDRTDQEDLERELTSTARTGAPRYR